VNEENRKMSAEEEEGFASVSGHGRYRRVEVRRVINAPIEKVWSAITNADEVRHWWAPGVIEPREGGRVKLDDGDGNCGDAPPLDGIVKVFLPPHVFEFTWNEATEPAQGLVRFDLAALDGDRTQITLTNLVLAKDILVVAVGWHLLVERVGQYIASNETLAANPARERELYSLYEAALG
jgi:uncharacterized protein YndB with AHSA1/START domain